MAYNRSVDDGTQCGVREVHKPFVAKLLDIREDLASKVTILRL
jgi:hypothetical protein